MASVATNKQKSDVTPGKLALIGVLAVVLGVVLYIQFGDVEGKSSVGTVPAPAATTAPTRSAKSAAKDVAPTWSTGVARKSFGARSRWQSPELALVVRYDPFALPASFPQPRQADVEGALAQSEEQKTQDAAAQQAALEAERTQLEAALAALRQQGVKAVLEKGDKYVAIIGDQEVHVGDEFQGFTVTAIHANGSVDLAKDLNP